MIAADTTYQSVIIAEDAQLLVVKTLFGLHRLRFPPVAMLELVTVRQTWQPLFGLFTQNIICGVLTG